MSLFLKQNNDNKIRIKSTYIKGRRVKITLVLVARTLVLSVVILSASLNFSGFITPKDLGVSNPTSSGNNFSEVQFKNLNEQDLKAFERAMQVFVDNYNGNTIVDKDLIELCNYLNAIESTINDGNKAQLKTLVGNAYDAVTSVNLGKAGLNKTGNVDTTYANLLVTVTMVNNKINGITDGGVKEEQKSEMRKFVEKGVLTNGAVDPRMGGRYNLGFNSRVALPTVTPGSKVINGVAVPQWGDYTWELDSENVKYITDSNNISICSYNQIETNSLLSYREYKGDVINVKPPIEMLGEATGVLITYRKADGSAYLDYKVAQAGVDFIIECKDSEAFKLVYAENKYDIAQGDYGNPFCAYSMSAGNYFLKEWEKGNDVRHNLVSSTSNIYVGNKAGIWDVIIKFPHTGKEITATIEILNVNYETLRWGARDQREMDLLVDYLQKERLDISPIATKANLDKFNSNSELDHYGNSVQLKDTPEALDWLSKILSVSIAVGDLQGQTLTGAGTNAYDYLILNIDGYCGPSAYASQAIFNMRGLDTRFMTGTMAGVAHGWIEIEVPASITVSGQRMALGTNNGATFSKGEQGIKTSMYNGDNGINEGWIGVNY